MNIKFIPSIRNTVLGGVAALSIASGVIVGCQNNTKNTESDNANLEQTLEALSNINKDTDSIRAQKIKEGLERIERNRILTDSIVKSMQSINNKIKED